jgi:hypothetical protein
MVIISARRRTRPAVLLYIEKRRDKLLTTAIPKIFLGFPDKQTNKQPNR